MKVKKTMKEIQLFSHSVVSIPVMSKISLCSYVFVSNDLGLQVT